MLETMFDMDIRPLQLPDSIASKQSWCQQSNEMPRIISRLEDTENVKPTMREGVCQQEKGSDAHFDISGEGSYPRSKPQSMNAFDLECSGDRAYYPEPYMSSGMSRTLAAI
jgi:hypothetical protein